MDSCHYKFHCFEKYHYYLPILKHTIITSYVLEICHYIPFHYIHKKKYRPKYPVFFFHPFLPFHSLFFCRQRTPTSNHPRHAAGLQQVPASIYGNCGGERQTEERELQCLSSPPPPLTSCKWCGLWGSRKCSWIDLNLSRGTQKFLLGVCCCG